LPSPIESRSNPPQASRFPGSTNLNVPVSDDIRAARFYNLIAPLLVRQQAASTEGLSVQITPMGIHRPRRVPRKARERLRLCLSGGRGDGAQRRGILDSSASLRGRRALGIWTESLATSIVGTIGKRFLGDSPIDV
ncbi:hypothetical protein FRC03_007934, partial [Tulasnella sp. 419]